MPNRILQFGTSRFLQAHADLFVHEARLAGQDIGPITVVKTSPGKERSGRVRHIARTGGFPVIIRGLLHGKRVEEQRQITSVTAALTAVEEWPALAARFAHETEIIFSNVSDSGYEIALADRSLTYAMMTAPAKRDPEVLARLDAVAGRVLSQSSL